MPAGASAVRFSRVLLTLVLISLARPSLQQICPSGRSLSSQSFGFLQAASHGVNDSFVYLVFAQNSGEQPSASSPLACSGSGSSRDARLAAMQRAEAALWSVRTFSSRYRTLLPGVTVGALLLDLCDSRLVTLQQLGNLQSCEVTFGSGARLVEPRATVGIVGLDSSVVAGAALPLLQPSGKAVVSYQLTDPQFSSRSSWPLLVRLAPDSLADAEALAQAARAAGATHAQLLVGASARHSAMASTLAARLQQLGVCVAARVQLTSSLTASAAASRVNSLASVRAVVVLLDAVELRSFAEQMLRLRPGSGVFSWLLPSELAGPVDELRPGREAFFAGSLLLRQFATTTSFASFQSAFKALRPDSPGRSGQNPWFSSFWSDRFNCSLSGGASPCNLADPAQSLQSVTSFSSSSARVIQGVDLVLHSLELTRRSLCGAGSSGLCAAFRSDAARFRSVFENLFRVRSGLGYAEVELSSATAGPSTYTLLVHNLQRSSAGFAWTPVGSFISGSFVLTSAPRAYRTAGSNATWASACSDAACLAACPASTTSVTTLAATTARGMSGTTLNSSFAEQLRFRSQYWVYALIVCASVGVIATLLFIVYILIAVLELPSQLKTFNTLWSGQILLLVILVGYVTLFAWVPWPNVELCGIIRFMVGFLYTAIYSILMVKLLNLINENLTPVYQVLLFFLSLAVQVATGVEWLLIVPSRVTQPNPTSSRCDHDFLMHLQMLIYCMVLVLLCVLLAVRAHRIGKNNREVIFIGCAAGLSIPVWLAWTLVGSLNDSQDFKDASMAFGLFVNLTLVLLVIFIPKIYQLRQLEREEAEPTGSDLSDFDNETNKEPIYVLAQPAPSVRSDSLERPVLLNLPGSSGRLVPISTTRSLAGDFHEASSLRREIPAALGSLQQPRKAYSDYNFPVRDLGRQLPRSSAKEETKAERLAKLGFL